jgi:hypothetical protein
MHGSSTPDSIRKAARLEALSVVTKGEIVVEGPGAVQVLKDLLAEAVAYKTYFAERMATLESLRYSSASGFEQQRSEWTFWSAAFDKAFKVATILSGMKLEELEKRIELARAQDMYDCYVAAVKSLGPQITPELDEALRENFAYQLRLRIPAGTTGTLEV